ncbi:MAG: flavodoxin [Oscillospiraceae bacterium]
MKSLKIKKLVCFVSAFFVLSALTACRNTNAQKQDAASGHTQSSVKTENSLSSESTGTAPEEEKNNSESRILIAYFTAAENSGVDAVASASYTLINGAAVGRVRAVADMVADNTGGKLFSIKTETVYPTNGGELIDFAAEEQKNNARPVLTSHIENLDDYDVIFVGYPNWWYDMPMALYSFFDEYDFSGKTIIPFNVHNGSRFSSTISTIRELEPAANVVTDGFTVSERSVAQAADDVADWLAGLGY